VEEKNLLSLLGIEPQFFNFPAHRLVTISVEPYQPFHYLLCLQMFQVKEKDSELEAMRKDMDKMRCVTQRLVADGGNEAGLTSPAHCIKAIKVEYDEGYFNTYSHFSIHHEMLSVSLKLLL
jgi:protein arginine N-methyltransferase 3